MKSIIEVWYLSQLHVIWLHNTEKILEGSRIDIIIYHGNNMLVL